MVAIPEREIEARTANRFGELLRRIAAPWLIKTLFRRLGDAMRDEKLTPDERQLAALFWDAM